MNGRIQGKACVVTGAGGGIGSATCKRFAAEGASGIICADIDETALNELVTEINEQFGKGKAIAIVSSR
jgi:2-hydroxycyclohexanecarboxyl-CoA dehydrogenase